VLVNTVELIYHIATTGAMLEGFVNPFSYRSALDLLCYWAYIVLCTSMCSKYYK